MNRQPQFYRRCTPLVGFCQLSGKLTEAYESPRLRPWRARFKKVLGKLTLENLNRALADAFFSHLVGRSLVDSTSNAELAGRLGRVLDVIFKAVSSHDFDPNGREWISESVIDDYFGPKQFAHLKNKIIRQQIINCYKGQAYNSRIIFRAICSLGLEIFSNEADTKYRYVTQLRADLLIEPAENDYRYQKEMLCNMEQGIAGINAPPDQLITFSSGEHNVLIKTHSPHFCHESSKNLNRISNLIAGKYVLYRELFNVINEDRRFIRESMSILPRPTFGSSVTLESKGGPADINSIFEGVALITDGIVTIMLHCDDPSARLRFFSVAIKDWSVLDSNNSDKFCNGVLLGNSHVSGIRPPASRNVLFRRELESDRAVYNWEECKVSHMSVDEISGQIEPSRLKWLTVNYLS